MKVTQVTLFNESTPEPLVLSFKDPSSQNPYQANNIMGLDADDIMWGLNGGRQEAKIRNRQVVARIGLNPRWAQSETYSDLRDKVFRIIQSTKTGEISLGFYNESNYIATISGRVIKMEASTFTKTPEMQVTIECRDPMLRGPKVVLVPVSGLDPTNTIITDSLSTAPHGVALWFRFNSPASTITIRSHDDLEFRATPIGTTFQTNDLLVCSSVYNNKRLFIQRGSTQPVQIPIADAIHSTSSWPIIFPGENHISVSGNVTWDHIRYNTAYWGI